MAEASSSRVAPKPGGTMTKDENDIEQQLYNACAKTGDFSKLWYQDDLLALDCMQGKTLIVLAECINTLVLQCLFRVMDKGGMACWKIVPNDTASSIRKMGEKERLVYFEIEAAGIEGIWVKTIKQRTNVPQAEVTQAIKKLEGKNLVKPFQGSKGSSKKLYILTQLSPSEDATGGVFYSDNGPDMILLGYLMKFAEVFIHRKAWETGEPSSTPNQNGKREMENRKDDNPMDDGILSGSKRWRNVKPMPAGYQGYATIGEVAKYLNASNILVKDKLMEAEVQRLLDLLCFDGRIEQVPTGGYRTILKPISNPYQDIDEIPKNGFSEVPCGGCPSFNICDETGPVNARTCTYFKDWLDLK